MFVLACSCYSQRHLSVEDRNLLEMHGVPVNPEGLSTPQLEVELRKLRRKLKNKMSAKDSRRRKKAYLCDLEEKSGGLEGRVSALQNENRILLAKLQQLQGLAQQQQQQKLQQKQEQKQAELSTLTQPTTSAISTSSSSPQQDAAPRACVLMMMLLVFSAANQPGALDGRQLENFERSNS